MAPCTGGRSPFSYSPTFGAQPSVVMVSVAAEVRLELLNLSVPLFLSGDETSTPEGLLDDCIWNMITSSYRSPYVLVVSQE